MSKHENVFEDIAELLDEKVLTPEEIFDGRLTSEILEEQNDAGESMLHIACRAGRADAVQFLLENHRKDIDLEATVCNDDEGLSGVTPLHYACFYGFAKIVKLLLDNGANPLAADDDERRPLELAIENNQCKVIDTFAKWAEGVKNDFESIDTAMSEEEASKLQKKLKLSIKKIQAGQYNQAKKYFEDIIGICDEVLDEDEEKASDIWTLYQKNRACIYLGKINYILKNYQEAINFYTKAISCKETLLEGFDGDEHFSLQTLFDGAEVYFYRSEAYLALSKPVKAEDDYKQALWQYGQNMSIEPDRTDIILSDAAKFGYADIVKIMLKHGAVPDKNIFANADKFTTSSIHDFKGKGVKALLEYRPSKSNHELPTILNLANDPISEKKKINNQILDYENTSDEASSGSENESFKVVNLSLAQNVANNNHHQFVRGVHYTPNYFDTKKRKKSTEEGNSHKKPVRSLGTIELAHEIAKKTNTEINYKEADELVKGYFKMLKVTPNKPELDNEYKPVKRKIKSEPAQFESLYYKFIQVYVNRNGYNSLFNEKGMARNFNFPFNKTPVVSITPAFNVSYAYASGERNNNPDHRFFGKCRLSTGELKHRHLGYVEVYLIDDRYYGAHGADIDKIKEEGKVSISHNFSFNQESFIESSIPQKYILGYQAFGLPSFNDEWSSKICDQYGLAKNEYNKARIALKEYADNNDVNQINEILKDVIIKVSKHQAALLEEQVKMILEGNPNNLIPSLTAL